MKILQGLFALVLITGNLAQASLDDWTNKNPASSPLARRDHTMVYVGSSEVLLFGGVKGSTIRSDTAIYNINSNTWSTSTLTPGPVPLYEHAMAYLGDDESGNARTVLFGGYDSTGTPVAKSDTWVYSDGSWTDKDPGSWVAGTDKPDARREHAMAYIGSGKAVLFGGSIESGTDEVLFGDTWIYDISNNTWTEVFPASSPSARDEHGMAYIGQGKVLLFGGDVNAARPDTYSGETWIYDSISNTWTQKTPSLSPSARDEIEMAYMGGQKVLLYGGFDSIIGRSDETWVYDLSQTAQGTWTEDANTQTPTARFGHGLAETSWNGSSFLVLFGGDVSPGGIDNDTWTFGGGDHPLPVELSTFAAIVMDDHIDIEWMTRTEVGNLGFELYRSTERNGQYQRIGFVRGAGDSGSALRYHFSDSDVQAGQTYFYYLEDISITGERQRSRIIEVSDRLSTTLARNPLPRESALFQNFPNPLNPEAWLPYALASDAEVTIDIYNALGQLVRRLDLGHRQAGHYTTRSTAAYWDGRDRDGEKVANGVYWYHLKAGDFNASRRMVVVK